MSPESSLWTTVRNNIPGHLQRIENLIGVGCPDVNACHDGNEVWLELKVCKGNFVYFQATQLAWFHQRVEANGRVKLLAQWNYFVKGKRTPHILIVDGKTVLKTKQHWVPMKNKVRVLVSEFFTADTYCFPKPYDWEKINNAIFNP